VPSVADVAIGGVSSGVHVSRDACALREERGPPESRSGSKRCTDRDHRRASGVDGFDDLGVIDPLQVDGGDAEVAVAELALDDDQRDAFARKGENQRSSARGRAGCSLPAHGPRE
jgi:hypothetical protein